MNQQSTISALLAIARAARKVVASENHTGRMLTEVNSDELTNLEAHLASLDGPASEGDPLDLAAACLSTYNRYPVRHVQDAGDVLAAACHEAAANSGWWIDTETGEDVRTWPKKFLDLWISAKLMLIVTEVAESMEGHRKNLKDDKLPHLPMFMVELADAMVRIGDLAGGLQHLHGVTLGQCIAEKMAYNAQRADHKIENRLAAGGKTI